MDFRITSQHDSGASKYIHECEDLFVPTLVESLSNRSYGSEVNAVVLLVRALSPALIKDFPGEILDAPEYHPSNKTIYITQIADYIQLTHQDENVRSEAFACLIMLAFRQIVHIPNLPVGFDSHKLCLDIQTILKKNGWFKMPCHEIDIEKLSKETPVAFNKDRFYYKSIVTTGATYYEEYINGYYRRIVMETSNRVERKAYSVEESEWSSPELLESKAHFGSGYDEISSEEFEEIWQRASEVDQLKDFMP